jgi:hypothetical protein
MNQNITDSMYTQLSRYQSSPSQLLNALQQYAATTVVQMVNNYFSQPNMSLPQALLALTQLMSQNNQTVMRNWITVTPVANTSNTGNPAIVATRHIALGNQVENALPETVVATCVADAQTGGIAGQETVNFVGQMPVADKLAWNYPGGSGCSINIRLVDASQPPSGGIGQWLTNGDMEVWVAGLPSGWHASAGASQIAISQGNAYTGNAALTMVGDGVTKTGVYQTLGTDTPFTPIPNDRLILNLWAKVDVLATAGVLEMALVDQNGTVINDASGNANLATQSLVALTTWGYAPWGAGPWGVPNGQGAWGTSAWGTFTWGQNIGTPYVQLSMSIRTPSVLPSQMSIRLRQSTALSSGSTLYIDRVVLTRPTALYQQGPAVAGFSGAKNVIRGDNWSLIVQNNRGGPFQNAFDSFFGMKGLGLLLPSAAIPTLPNSLVS